MPLDGTQTLKQARTFYDGLTLRQKITLVAGTAAVAATIWVFVRLIGNGDYRPLYTGLAPAEAQSIARRLAARNIPYELTSDGTGVRVPAAQLDSARIEIASQGMPQSGRLGFELFDKPNWAGSDFAEKVNYQRALEGELERTIQSMDQVEAARVHLVLPRESLFTEREREAKASVVVRLRGRRLNDDAIEAITNLTASAVDNLKPENVTVINADGQVPLLARARGNGGHAPAGDIEKVLAGKIVATLEPLVGPGSVKASVNAEFELGSTDVAQETYDPNGSVVLTSQISEERSGEAGPEGVPGTPSNAPSAQPAGTPPTNVTSVVTENQGQRTESKTFAVSKTLRHVVQPAGGLKRLAAAVLVDDALEVHEEKGKKVEKRRKRTQDEMKQFQELAMAAIGFDAARGDRVAIENLSFQSLPLEVPENPTATERWAPMVQKWMGLIRYLALAALFGLVYVLFLRPMKRQMLAILKPAVALAGAGSPRRLSESAPVSPAAELDAESPLLNESTEVGSEAKRAVMLKRHLVDKVKREPAQASRLVENWLREGEGRK